MWRRRSSDYVVQSSCLLKTVLTTKLWQASDVDDLSDVQILERLKAAPKLSEESNGLGAKSIWHITDGTVAKEAQDIDEGVYPPSESLALDLVYRETTIPVPRVRRVVRSGYNHYIIMDYIPGRQLWKVWPSMATWEKIRVAVKMREYVRQLRSIRHPRSTVPGPMAPHGARTCMSPLFGPIIEYRGPFESYSELSDFFNERHRIALTQVRRVPRETAIAQCHDDPFDDSQPLVFTHHDINMRNIFLGDDGRLWLLDWAWAGFWPPWFEYVATKMQAENEAELLKRDEPLWNAMVPFICGSYRRQEEWYQRASSGMSWI